MRLSRSNREAYLDDAGFMQGYFFDCASQQVLVLKFKRCNSTHNWLANDVGAVEKTSDSNFNDCHVNLEQRRAATDSRIKNSNAINVSILKKVSLPSLCGVGERRW